jgi:glutathione S-transferase
MRSSSNYAFYYWPVPFRGNFIRILFAYLQIDYEEMDVQAISALRQQSAPSQTHPVMTVPVLVDKEAQLSLSQMPAIAFYLAQKHGLLPASPAQQALTLKVLGDCTDVIAEITRHEGSLMWTQEHWDAFESTRLTKWLEIFESLAVHQGLPTQTGIFGDRITLADLAMTALWGTLQRCFPALGPLIQGHAPHVSALVDRLSALPAIQALFDRNAAQSGSGYCGGQIEASLRSLSMGASV